MIALASLNLAITITRVNQSAADIETVKQAYDRLTSLAQNLLAMRSLLNIANGYEPDSSTIITDRFSEYHLMQSEVIEDFKNTLAKLENTKFVKSAEL